MATKNMSKTECKTTQACKTKACKAKGPCKPRDIDLAHQTMSLKDSK